MFDYFRNYSSNARHVCCEDSPTKVCIHDHCQSDDLDLHSRSQVHLKLSQFLICNISNYILQTFIWLDHLLVCLHDMKMISLCET